MENSELRASILKRAGLSPKAFCPSCWHQVKRLLRLMESEERKKNGTDKKGA